MVMLSEQLHSESIYLSFCLQVFDPFTFGLRLMITSRVDNYMTNGKHPILHSITRTESMGSSSDVQESSVPQFSKLPVELRCIIWFHALPAPRARWLAKFPLKKWSFIEGYNQLVSPLLYACRESNQVYFQYYSRLTRIEGSSAVLTRRSYCLINFDVDAIYIIGTEFENWRIHKLHKHLAQLDSLPGRNLLQHIIWTDTCILNLLNAQAVAMQRDASLNIIAQKILGTFPALKIFDVLVDCSEPAQHANIEAMNFEDATERANQQIRLSTRVDPSDLLQLRKAFMDLGGANRGISFRYVKIPSIDGENRS